MTDIFNFGPVLDKVLAGVSATQAQVAVLSASVTTMQGTLANIISNQQLTEITLAEDFTRLMQADADLKAEVADIGSKVVAAGAQLDALMSDLAAAQSTGNQAAIDEATAAVQAEVANLQTFGNDLQTKMTADTPPTPPTGGAPSPVPTPPAGA